MSAKTPLDTQNPEEVIIHLPADWCWQTSTKKNHNGYIEKQVCIKLELVCNEKLFLTKATADLLVLLSALCWQKSRLLYT